MGKRKKEGEKGREGSKEGKETGKNERRHEIRWMGGFEDLWKGEKIIQKEKY